ncbi:MAG: 50S ribosomal protein L17 [Thermodesulfobacteriota bacterium]
MRHRKTGYKLGRTTSHRKAMLRNMVTSLFEHDRINTTAAKAKAARPLAEKMITLAKRGDLHARRLVLAVLTKKSATHRLFTEIKDRYMDRAGGYTSIVRTGTRHGDGSAMAVLELLKPAEKIKGKKKPRKRKAAKKAEAVSKKIEEQAAPAPEPKEAKAEKTVPAPEAPAESPGTAPETKAEDEPEEKQE